MRQASATPAGGRRRAHAIAFATWLGVSLAAAPHPVAAQDNPDFWRVAGVAASDTLNLRSGPSTQNRVIARAPNGAVFRNLGCQGSGNVRWCHLETPDGRVSGWAAGSYLAPTTAPGSGNISGSDEVPELHLRLSGEFEVRYARGCTAMFSAAGRRTGAGGSCSAAQLSRANDAVQAHLRSHDSADAAQAGGTTGKLNILGSGTLVGGGQLTATIWGRNEGHYVLTTIGAGTTCTGVIRHAPGTIGSEATPVLCSNGTHGTAVLGRNGRLLTLTLTDGTTGMATF